MDHFLVLIQVALLGEVHVALATTEGALTRMRPQMVKVLAHGEYRELACLGTLGVLVLTLE